MEDCAVSEEQARQVRFILEKQKLDKDGWRRGWAEKGIHLRDEQVEAEFQEALRWFRKHPTFISPDIEHFFPEECAGCHKNMGFFITAHIDDPQRMGLYVGGSGQWCPQCFSAVYPHSPAPSVTDLGFVGS